MGVMIRPSFFRESGTYSGNALAALATVTCLALSASSAAAAAGGDQPQSPPPVQKRRAAGTSLEKAENFYASGKFSSAAYAFSQAISKTPENKELYRKRGLTRMQLGDYERAVEDFRIANQDLGPYRETKFPGFGAYLDWKRARQQYEHANYVLNRLEKPEQAITMYQTALAVYPTFPQCLHNLAIAFGKTEDYDQAVENCIKAISFRYTDWKFWNTLGLELYHQGKPRTAIRAFKQALNLEPSEPNRVAVLENIEFARDRLP